MTLSVNLTHMYNDQTSDNEEEEEDFAQIEVRCVGAHPL